MSGYESIRDWSFEEFDIDNYDTFQNWLDEIEYHFNQNGRGIDLIKIFSIQDYIDLENEWYKRKGIIEEEEEEEEEEEIEIEIEDNIITETIKEIFDPIVKTVQKVTSFLKGLFGR